MVKKRLSDLLQEEAEKYTPDTTAEVIEVNAQAINDSDSFSEEELASPTPPATTTRRSYPTKAELEVTLQQLQAKLEQAKEIEKNLQEKIADLQAHLAEQEALVERLKKELYDAKKAALQLAEENSKLIAEKNTTKPEKETKPPETTPKPTVYKPVPYKKNYPRVERQVHPQPPVKPESPDDFAANTWLYD
ncbi:MAG: hypothetical protein VKL59_14950 [Nostocaceae cyanobacterium]|nr:hypothetical protein [Nostocaceae cyanobacterium]